MKVLVVEDEPNSMKLMMFLLKKYGHEPISAFSGEEGIIKAASSRPDLILMDINLPGIDGLETTRRIKKMENMADIPIIAVTAHAMEDELETIKMAGCNGCLDKPIDPITINDRILEIMGFTK